MEAEERAAAEMAGAVMAAERVAVKVAVELVVEEMAAEMVEEKEVEVPEPQEARKSGRRNPHSQYRNHTGVQRRTGQRGSLDRRPGKRRYWPETRHQR